MEAQRNPQPIPPPPGVITAIKSGMDVISSHLSVLLLPLALDLMLWFGPRLSVQKAYSTAMDQFVELYAFYNMPVSDLLKFKEFFGGPLEKFDLLGLLRTFPIGISSLMSAKMPLHTPLGIRSVVDIKSEGGFLGWVFLLTIIGWALGGLYFHWVSRVTGNHSAEIGTKRAIVQTLLFSIVFTLALLAIGIPAIIVIGVIGLISPAMMQAAVFVLALFSAWIVVPIFFAPHGIYLSGQNAFYSIYSSLRMARFTLPTSSMFVMAVFIISQGLNFLWAVPEDNSWMMVVGIAGHAFVTTALLAASFIYYRDMNAWLEIVFQRLKTHTAAPQT